MVLISDLYISLGIEAIFLYVFISILKFNIKNRFITILNICFMLVNILVVMTIIISKVDSSISNIGWLLGFLTGLSYLILPWLFYWFISNFSQFLNNEKTISISKFQTFSLIAIIIIGFAPVLFTDLIGISKLSEINFLYNWTYDWKLLVSQFIFWILFLILYVIAVDTAKRKILENDTAKELIKYINYSAIIVFSTPVFFIIDSGFILLSFAIYVVSYYIIFIGLKNYITRQSN